MGGNPSYFKGDELPVENVSWLDVQQFLKKTEELSPGLGLSLPTEAQWEYACRAGTQTPFAFGENITTAQVNYDGNYPYANGPKGKFRKKTVDVKSFQPNGWGIYQMHGNVDEWCSDWYGEYPKGSVTDPSGPDRGLARVLRGGSWSSLARHARSAHGLHYQPGARDYYVGLRVSRGRTSKSQ